CGAEVLWGRGEGPSMTLAGFFAKHGIRHCRLLNLTAPGNVLDILTGFKRSGCVDLLCGEADVDDGGRAKLEVASWSIARQHFWRIQDRQGADRQGPNRQGVDRHGPAKSAPWIHQLPTGCEEAPSESKTPSRVSGH